MFGVIPRCFCLCHSHSAVALITDSAGIPRTADGKLDLSAPTPCFPDGEPDLYGIWTSDKPALPFGERLIEIKPEDVVLTPVGEALQRQRTDLS